MDFWYPIEPGRVATGRIHSFICTLIHVGVLFYSSSVVINLALSLLVGSLSLVL